MNTVSWLIYLTYVIPSVSWFATVFAFGLVISALLSLFVYGVAKSVTNEVNATKEDRAFPNAILKQLKWIVPSAALCFFVANIVPDQQTMYMIAASELGEEVIISDEAKVLYQDLRDILATYKAKEVTK